MLVQNFFFQFQLFVLCFLLFFGHNLLPKAHLGGFQGGYGVWGGFGLG